jgi:hypothetical protein
MTQEPSEESTSGSHIRWTGGKVRLELSSKLALSSIGALVVGAFFFGGWVENVRTEAKLVGNIADRVDALEAAVAVLRPRALTAEQKDAIAAMLKGNPSVNCTVEVPGNDAEAADYAEDLLEAMSLGGWDLSRNTRLGTSWNGIHIRGPTAMRSEAYILLAALARADLKPGITVTDEAAYLTLMVGSRAGR